MSIAQSGCRSSGPPRPSYHSRMSIPPEYAVAMLGAGATAAAGAPLMHGFIDRSRDYLYRGTFTEEEEIDVRAAIALYDSLQRGLSITQEDTENVETLLSIADLASVISDPPLESLRNKGLPYSIRRYIETVITKSIHARPPASHEWLGGSGEGPFIYKQLARALAFHGNRASVITLNYDCLLEYTCYCLGIPFTYDRNRGSGIEILKLHGSSNWVRCTRKECSDFDRIIISPVKYVPIKGLKETGYIQRILTQCPKCDSTLSPIIVPPSWAKNVDEIALRSTWSRAASALARAEAFVSVGFSLPVTDAHVRHLLHVGFSSGRLRQGLAVVGKDETSAQRWSSLFRKSWRDARFDVLTATFANAMDNAIAPAMVIPKEAYIYSAGGTLLPIPFGSDANETARQRLADAVKRLRARGEVVADIDTNRVMDGHWTGACQKFRQGEEPKGQFESITSTVLREAGYFWRPEGEIMPSHIALGD